LQFDLGLPGGLKSLLRGSDCVMPRRQLGDGVETYIRGDRLANQVCTDILNLDGGPWQDCASAVGNGSMKYAIDGLSIRKPARKADACEEENDANRKSKASAGCPAVHRNLLSLL
jgi:hypothetical protein